MHATIEHMTDTTKVFGISRLAYFVVPLLMVIWLMLMGISAAWFAWTIIIPAIVAWWIWRMRTTVDAQGITSVTAFKTVRVPWHDVAGLRFPKWSTVRVVLNDDSTVRLPAVGFNDLPILAEASCGRVPDPFAAERKARLAAG